MAATAKQSDRPSQKIGTTAVLTIFAVGWLAITLTFDGLIGWNAYRQLRG